MKFFLFRKSYVLKAVSLVLLLDGTPASACQEQDEIVVSSILGTENLSSPFLKELYTSAIFQRLKNVDQSGPSHYFGKVGAFSRFDHSIGVFSLLKKHNCSLAEQAAGLMHDVSHTAFSHLGDYLFLSDVHEAVTLAKYQDDIHLKYLKEHHIDEVAKRYDLNLGDLDPDNKRYLALEQPLPNLCADRIEYILHTAIVTKKLKAPETHEILDDLQFDGTNWFFTKPNLARKFSELSLLYTKELWGPAWNIRLNIHFAEAVKRCFALKVLTPSDLSKTDQEILQKIQAYQRKHKDPLIQLYWDQCENINNDLPGVQYNVIRIKPKFRGVDPFVKTNGGLVRLTAIDSSYKQEFDDTKQWCENGVDVRVIIPPTNLK